MSTADVILSFLVAAGLGGLIGLERQVGRPAEGEYAGLRTFALFATWGAGSAFLGEVFGGVAFAVALAGFVALVLVEYWGSLADDRGVTTEAASFATFVIGVLVWTNHALAALALSIGIAFLLEAKAWIHGVVSRFSGSDLEAALRFGVLTAVVLPLLPDEPMGPFGGFNPFETWLMVVFVAGIGLVGYVSLRVLGPRGLAPTGLLGGLVSSTAVTLGFSRMSRKAVPLSTALTAGVLAACGLMYARVLVEAAVVGPAVVRHLVWPLAGLFVLVEGAAVWWWRRSDAEPAGAPALEVRNPLTLGAALQFGALYAVVAFVAAWLVERVSEASLTALGAVSGINDVDAITLATSNLVADGAVAPDAGARAILLAAIVNTAVKGGLAVWLGGRALGLRVAGVLGAATALGGAAWFLI